MNGRALQSRSFGALTSPILLARDRGAGVTSEAGKRWRLAGNAAAAVVRGRREDLALRAARATDQGAINMIGAGGGDRELGGAQGAEQNETGQKHSLHTYLLG